MMNHSIVCTLNFVIMISLFSSINASNDILFQKKPSSERAENAKFVLANIAQMIGQIGTIVEEPHNPDTVENAVTSIVSNIVKITMHAVQNKSLTIQEAQNILTVLRQECTRFGKTHLKLIPLKIEQQESSLLN